MFKQWAILAGLGIFAGNVNAQAFEGKVKFDKTEEPAIVMVFDYPEKIVENALFAKFADLQLTRTNSKGFTMYPNAVIDEVSKSKLDYYFKIEEAGKKGQEKTSIYMVMQGAGTIEGLTSLGQRGKAFLESMQTDVQRSSNIAKIKKQEEILVDEEKTLLDLVQEQKDLEERLAKNKNKQDAQGKIIASQKMLLDDLKTKLN